MKATEHQAGLESGQKQRYTDRSLGVYPRENMPINKKKSDTWTTAYQNAYYQPNSVGKPLESKNPKITITIRVDSGIVTSAKDLHINMSKACQDGIKNAIELKNLNPSQNSL